MAGVPARAVRVGGYANKVKAGACGDSLPGATAIHVTCAKTSGM